MRITWHTTAAVTVSSGETTLHFDPFLPLPGAETPVAPEAYGEISCVLVTHGHIDHVYSLPALAPNAAVYATKTPALTLARRGMARVHVIKPGDELRTGTVSVRVLPGRHIRYDARLACRTLWRLLRAPHGNSALLWRSIRTYPEAGEPVAYELQAEGLRVLVLGSAALAPTYATEVDWLCLPYQGRSDICGAALEIVQAVRPKNVMLTHFDDAFPPASEHIDTAPFVAQAAARWPGMRVHVPRSGVTLEL